MTVSEQINNYGKTSYPIIMGKIYYNGKIYTQKESYDFPVGTKYSYKTLIIYIDEFEVTNIKISYDDEIVTQEWKDRFIGK